MPKTITSCVVMSALAGSGGSEVAVNLRLVRYASPVAEGTKIFFAKDDTITITCPFSDFRRWLEDAFDEETED